MQGRSATGSLRKTDSVHTKDSSKRRGRWPNVTLTTKRYAAAYGSTKASALDEAKCRHMIHH